MTPDTVRLGALLTGRAKPFTRPGAFSAIHKSSRNDTLRIKVLGLEGDEQGDLRVHGGVDKAIHHYPWDHYAAWVTHVGLHPLLTTPGGFGENFSTCGWTEDNICIGDRIQAGTAVLEVSQGRMPCWKLNDRFETPGIALKMQQSGFTGWYYRVLQEGFVAVGDELRRVARPHPDWPLRRVSDVIFSRDVDPRLVHACLELPLPPPLRKILERRSSRGTVEDWTSRLDGRPKADK